jgi:hypothetical protein
MARWRLWWHTHPRMGASYSGTDEDTLEMLAAEMEDGYFLGMVINTALSTKCYYAQTTPFPLRTELGPALHEQECPTEALEAAEEMLKRVTVPPPVVYELSRQGVLPADVRTGIDDGPPGDYCWTCGGPLAKQTVRGSRPSGAVIVTSVTVCAVCGLEEVDCTCITDWQTAWGYAASLPDGDGT